MLQRAASNAYSWWWASHIRTRQSNWLEQNLQDMEDKVKTTLLLIEEDADSFAKRAEMYYKKKPELINFVEESYRAYRALAERYDHISGELHNANNTIATVFPHQVQFPMEEDDDDDDDEDVVTPKAHPKASAPPLDHIKSHKGLTARAQIKIPSKDMRKPLNPKIPKTRKTNSQMSKEKAREEIDKLQKGILVLQTEKEFVMSSYESALTKYLDIEKNITEMQEKVCGLQDEFTEAAVIEDDDARALMTATALKSCEETLVKLQEQQSRSIEEAGVESNRIKDVEEKLKALKEKFFHHQTEDQNLSDEATVMQSNSKSMEEEISSLKQERLELQLECEEVKECYETNPETPLTVADLAEKIDELVNKVISLENAVSSQTAQIKRLRLEADELQKHLESLEQDKMRPIDGSMGHLSIKIREVEEELHGIQDLNRHVEVRNNVLQTDFTKARCNLNDLSEKMQCSKLQDKVEITSSSQAEKNVLLVVEPHEQCNKQDMMPLNENSANFKGNNVEQEEGTGEIQDPRQCVEREQYKDQDMMPLNDNSANLETQEILDPRQRVEHEHCKEKDMMPLNDNSANLEGNNVEQEETEEIQDPRQCDEDQKNPFQSEACCNSNDSSEKLQDQNQEEEVENRDSFEAKDPALNVESQKQNAEQEDFPNRQDQNQEGIDSKESSQAKDSVIIVEPQKQNTEQEDFPSWQDWNQQEGIENRDSSQAKDSVLNVEQQNQNREEVDFPNWQQLCLNGLEDREKILLAEYTSILRNYKETKRRLSQIEKKNQDDQFEMAAQIWELKSTIAMKDEEIQSLRQKLSLLQASQDKNSHTHMKESKEAQFSRFDDTQDDSKSSFPGFRTESSDWPNAKLLEDLNAKSTTRDKPSVVTATEAPSVDEDIKTVLINEPNTASAMEEKFRRDVDEQLEQNLQFWLRFSTSFHQIQKFKTMIQELQGEFSKSKKDNKKQESNATISADQVVKSEAVPIDKHLRELQTDLKVWVEQNASLKEELYRRFSSLCNIQEEISRALEMGSKNRQEFTAYQAAKFQGEVLNMQQENKKVAEELQAGLDHVIGLQSEVEKILSKLHGEVRLPGSKNLHHHVKHSISRTRIPLRAFIFGARQKKPSLFACMNPALQKQSSDLNAGIPM